MTEGGLKHLWGSSERARRGCGGTGPGPPIVRAAAGIAADGDARVSCGWCRCCCRTPFARQAATVPATGTPSCTAAPASAQARPRPPPHGSCGPGAAVGCSACSGCRSGCCAAAYAGLARRLACAGLVTPPFAARGLRWSAPCLRPPALALPAAPAAACRDDGAASPCAQSSCCWMRCRGPGMPCRALVPCINVRLPLCNYQRASCIWALQAQCLRFGQQAKLDTPHMIGCMA